MTSVRFSRLAYSLCALAAAAACGSAQAQYAKLDGALSDLIDSLQPKLTKITRPTAAATATASARLQSGTLDRAMLDPSNRILVDIYLDGSMDMALFVSQLQALGATVTGSNPSFANGAVSAWVPVSSLASISTGGGLNVMKMSARPQTSVGNVTSQGTKTIRSDVANTSGFLGAGITVGVLSDSYDTATTTTIRAANDIASNDLVAPKLVIDLGSAATDEGRGMMQIVHDVAPGAALCFATAFSGEAAFADNIRTLRTNPACAADVIVDDVFYYDEPYFSDGQVAQAVNDVSTSTTLPGKQVAYFSSAGNYGGAGGGGSIDVPVANFSTTPTGIGNINLASAATCTSSPATGSTKADVAGGWLDFGGGTYSLPVTLTVGANGTGTLGMQWDDLFFQGKVTTDLNFFLFSSTGACVFAFANNNFTTDSGQEFIQLGFGAAGGTFTGRIMVARTSAGTQQATRLRLTNFGGWSSSAFTMTSPTTFGHADASSANSVAAYRYSYPYTSSPYTPVFEPFSSPGPVAIMFDAAGNRLPVAETRKKPDIAAPDGVDTTFFPPGAGNDADGDGFPNFFGTSAAAPHAAGVAALLISKAGGPGSLTPKQVKSILQTTAPARAIVNSGSATPTKGWSLYDGFGLIDAVGALNKLP